MSCGYRKSQKPHEHRIFALLAPPCTEVHRAPRCIPAAWHRIAPCTTVHHHLCAPAPWCIPAAWHRGAPCTTVRDRPCAPALRCISASLHHGARCSTMCDPVLHPTLVPSSDGPPALVAHSPYRASPALFGRDAVKARDALLGQCPLGQPRGVRRRGYSPTDTAHEMRIPLRSLRMSKPYRRLRKRSLRSD